MLLIPDFVQIGLYIILAIFLTGITFYTVQRRNDARALLFSIGLVFQIIWIVAFILEIICSETSIKLIFDTFIIIASYFVGTAYFLFSLEYNEFKFKKQRKFYYFIFIYSILLLFPVLLFPYQPWMRINVRSEGVFSIIRYANGIYLNILIGEVYLKVLFTFILFIRNLFLKTRSRLVKKQSLIMAISYMLLFFASIVSVWSEPLGIVERFISFYLLGLIFAGVFIFIAVFPLRTFEILPAARNLILDNIGDGYCVFSDKNQLLEMNEELMKILGVVDKSIVIGKKPYELFSHLPNLMHLAETPHNISTELNIELWDKNHFYEADKVTILRRRRNLGFVLIFHDISQRKEHEQNLKASKEDLERKFQHAQKIDTVGQLAGGIAHDFNNILTIILGNAELLAEKISDDKENGNLLDELTNAALNASRMTKQLLMFSKKSIVHPSVVYINELLNRMQNPIQRLIGEDMDIELRMVLSPDVDRIFVDVGLMEQILINLILNARDAMPMGGVLEISTKNMIISPEIRHLYPEAEQTDYVCIQVTDTGIGMTEEVKNHLFEPFFSTKPKGTGTGLGLSMVYGAVKQFHGFINVTSEPNSGTSILISIPVIHDAIPKQVPKNEELLYQGNEELIVLVEDDASVRNITQKLLIRMGYQVLNYGSGLEAIEELRSGDKKIALLFTDIVMPEIKGHELYEQLKNYYPDLKVLYASGYTDKIIGQYGVLFKDTNFIAKPYTVESLAEKIYDIIHRQ